MPVTMPIPTSKQSAKPHSKKPCEELRELEAAIAKGWTCVRASKRYKSAVKAAKQD